MEVKAVENPSKYLGLPALMGKSKRLIFSSSADRLGSKLSSWKASMLSQAAREVLIKSIAQAIPNYVMSCFLIPKGICQELERLICNFWWGNNEKANKIHWVGWEKLCLPKSQGGLGFRSMSSFNEALFAKQGWRLIHNDSYLVARVLKECYYPNTDFMHAKMGNNPSFT